MLLTTAFCDTLFWAFCKAILAPLYYSGRTPLLSNQGSTEQEHGEQKMQNKVQEQLRYVLLSTLSQVK